MTTIREQLAAFHNPQLVECPEGGLVCEVWEDGEVTITESGRLYGHSIVRPLPATLPLDDLPRRVGSHASVVCRYEDRGKVRALIAIELKRTGRISTQSVSNRKGRR